MSRLQATSHNFLANRACSKLSEDLILALRNELHALKIASACESLRNDIRARDSKLDRDIAALHKHNYILQEENRELHDMLETLVSSANMTQPVPLNINDTKALPPILRVGDSNLTYSLVSTEGSLANFLAARHLTNANHNSTRRSLSDTNAVAAGLATKLKPPEDDWREPTLFYTMLTVVVLYILLLLCVFFKNTADAQLRQQPRKASRNASLEFWKKHREEEREKKARQEMREEREKMALAEQRKAGVEGIRGFMSS
ncbi:uncharacterized protein K460DRAFT_152847 [Cucurbitaria berberidis CBS 394.84]|uniref:Uncharacterized protein n=1 Tax=Cucurbitaria berberidis CBS 394.84 TaxID=1168544 RepID=A0A9P4GDD8_9PLEO|nr:uncharacterized protein K460DRAFT_152847 [Cucurbitaria berberidis CBS 394.84]KAF1843868.1 hypothetical protein K460DRAFT_152847 [Cucurbitaria berberidis CBS 394.84]